MNEAQTDRDAGRLLVVGDVDLGGRAARFSERLGPRATLVHPEDVARELSHALYEAMLLDAEVIDRSVSIARLSVTHPLMPVILIGEDDSSAARAFAEGAWELIAPDASPTLLAARLAAALSWRRLARDARSNARRRAGRGPWFGHSDVAESLLEKIDLLALVDTAVCLHGSAGCMPERIARAIHRAGPRAGAPFRTSGPDALDIDEAIATRDGGTLFIEHVERLRPGHRQALLNAVQSGADRSFRLIVFSGDDSAHPDDALTGWLGSQSVRIPSLAERREDLPECVEELLDRSTLEDGRAVWIADDAMAVLRSQEWEGDVAELERVVSAARERSSVEITLADLPSNLQMTIERDTLTETLDGADDYGDRAGSAVEAAHRRAVDETIEVIDREVGTPDKQQRLTRKKYRIR